MARPSKLKLFRTAIGFHDAYVAAPSRAAALRAWGSDKDLFARGVAEEVDPATAPEALAAPGTVLRRLRGTAAEQVAALPPDKPRSHRTKRKTAAPAPPHKPAPRPAPKPKPPRPSRAELEAAEQALFSARQAHARAQAALRAEEQALARRRHAMSQEQQEEEARLDAARIRADRAYRDALEVWHGVAD